MASRHLPRACVRQAGSNTSTIANSLMSRKTRTKLSGRCNKSLEGSLHTPSLKSAWSATQRSLQNTVQVCGWNMNMDCKLIVHEILVINCEAFGSSDASSLSSPPLTCVISPTAHGNLQGPAKRSMHANCLIQFLTMTIVNIGWDPIIKLPETF